MTTRSTRGPSKPASDQNVWGVNMSTSTRAILDNKGALVKQPSVNGQPMGNNKCPAGDSCPNAGAYTYSDFTGFGLRVFTRPHGSYSVVVPGCTDNTGAPANTEWDAVTYDAAVPPNTSLVVHARAANSANLNGAEWGNAVWSTDAQVSPLNLQNNLMPNAVSGQQPAGELLNGFLQVEFILKTQDQKATPKLKGFQVGWKCPKIVG